jgi:hypothetical protein
MTRVVVMEVWRSNAFPLAVEAARSINAPERRALNVVIVQRRSRAAVTGVEKRPVLWRAGPSVLPLTLQRDASRVAAPGLEPCRAFAYRP